ncbi:MAG: DUF1643 domain-containing protein [Oscillospiraceae bacterium]|jgi:hypothetical protein|nr:DUF1643 domain-containing protein [Oscillospiraceae bacterium]
MHIPSTTTDRIEVLTFADACLHSDRSEEYDRDKWLYIPDFYSEYRYILGTKGANPLICIGINPSTARPDALDNTLKSVERIALGNGFDSFTMFNVYAQRATNPDDMERELNEHLHTENMKAFDYVLSQSENPVVWAAWGAIIEKRKYLPHCVRDMIEIGRKHNARWVCAGKISKKGHPHHPLYLRKDEPVRDFDIVGYIDNIIGT